MKSRIQAVMSVVVAVAVLAGSASSGFAQASPADYQKVLQEKSPAFVTVKFVLKVQMGGMGENESEMEITGAMIDPKGLVLCSNTQLGGIGGLMRAMGRGEIVTTPTQIKVIVDEDPEGLDAKLIARDTELDLAWVQIEKPGDRTFPAIDLTKGSEAKVGQPLVGIRRLPKFFDRTAVVSESRVAGIARKPRRLYVPTLPLSSLLGLPIFTAEGRVVGVAVMQMPGEEDEDGGPAAQFSRMSTMQEVMIGFLLPAEDVVEATRRARQAAATKPVADEEQAAPQARPTPAAQPDDAEDEE